VLPHLDSGNLKVLGTIEAARSRSRPDIPTIGETVPGYAIPSSWLGFAGPAGMDEKLVGRMHADFTKAVTTPKVTAALQQSGFEIVTATPPEFRQMIANGVQRFKKITTDAKIEPQ